MSGPTVVEVGTARLACLVDGDPGAPLVLCAHGFPDCARSFRHQTAALVGAGFRVVAPWMRGYAPSTVATDGRYDPAALGRDLCALADHFSPSAPVRLVGHDWGAIAALAAAALAPERFSHVCTVAVPHPRAAAARFLRPRQLRRSAYMGLFQLRGVAERLLAGHDFALVERLWRSWSPGWSPPPEELQQVKDALRSHANRRAVLDYYRALPSSALGDRGRLLFRRTRVPALHVHGVDDGCVGIELVRDLERGYERGVRVVRIEGAGHFVHQERPDIFNRETVRFLTGS